MGNLANSEDPCEMQHNAAFHQSLHCLLLKIKTTGTEMHDNFCLLPLKIQNGQIPYFLY